MEISKRQPVLIFFSLCMLATGVIRVDGLQNVNVQLGNLFGSAFNQFSSNKNALIESQLLKAIKAEADPLSIESIIGQLEALPSLPEPAIAPQLYGRWNLKYTTSQSTSSPIQRTATTKSNLPIFQDIVVEQGQLVVKQVIQFTDNAYLTVDALGSTAAYPLKELTERQSTGKVLGLNLLGVSLVGEEAAPDPNKPNTRVDFVFDEGYFHIGGFRIPYPVPFRSPLFRDWVKGWIDITYLSETMRIAKGNKGSTFVLVKEENASSNTIKRS